MYVVDASVWVGRFVQRDVHHAASRVWLTGVMERQESVVMPSIALPEIAGAVARQTDATDLGLQVVALIQELPNVRLVPVDRTLADLAAQSAAEQRLRGADAVYAALARYLGIPLVTWDKELQQRAGFTVDTFAPSGAGL